MSLPVHPRHQKSGDAPPLSVSPPTHPAPSGARVHRGVGGVFSVSEFPRLLSDKLGKVGANVSCVTFQPNALFRGSHTTMTDSNRPPNGTRDSSPACWVSRDSLIASIVSRRQPTCGIHRWHALRQPIRSFDTLHTTRRPPTEETNAPR